MVNNFNFFKNSLFFIALLKLSVKSSIKSKSIFFIEFFLMSLNNILFFSLWGIFFYSFNSINGWGMKEMTYLLAIGNGGYGLMLVFFGGVRYLGKLIQNGELDIYMTYPKNVLLHVISSKSFPRGWGDIFTAILLLFFGEIHLKSIVLVIIGMFLGCIVFTSMAIITYSLSFWLQGTEHLAKQYHDALAIFSMYPQNIYKGIMQLFLFTIIPAGIISYLPIKLIANFSFLNLACIFGIAFLFIGMAILIFNLGLKRYESGSHFIMR